mmetsp:Transcript_11227/g.19917  ORF Transcript_11227/g.19917 Transcript_11227/m.19917 type:complete len:524 (-) Transcript_11227:239-1810(-)|eukprot:CAMPEP_0197651050 /NCGR_PEP_ID=MMETSP1338-20131121/31319_1 /TAXON_ID=43686 ORGANISM="Pelagodinium beii, Strain RCC1491" /NCGR_SAMPLE_ID=MMETSP1338 /ASSEMBLY_ACC=CAM_ASM_000754 /LENGTH=523 /DNA_ID=CAMNT_0043225597 /DNA_START=76 /DNA_END=1647 /DNA_ORIENTATION=-
MSSLIENYGTLADAKGKRISESERMYLNGESKEQMAHAAAIKAAGGVSLNKADGNDTSKDQVWKLDQSTSAERTDTYVLVTTIIWLGIKLPLMAIPMLLANTPALLIARLYIACLPPGTQRVKRSPVFYCAFSLALILSLPAAALILLSLALDSVVYYLFSGIYCTALCRWSNLLAGWEKIEPYRNGPSIILHLPDFFVAVMGQCARQGFTDTMYMVSVMWMLMPWLKYYICCNPWVYDLDHRLCQQISTSMKDLGPPSKVADMARKIISRAVQRDERTHRINSWSFVPHYPFPPPDRRWALGLQSGGAAYPGKFTLIVHTTHAESRAGGCDEQFVLSNSCEQPIYRVMLWYSNPFHFLTGWVEASVSTGMPSQPVKTLGGEHPMWLVTGRNPMIAGRDAFTGSGMIDAFFDYWLPVFVHEMRRTTWENKLRKEGEENWGEKAKDYADEMYEEVNSKDGVSSPNGIVGREKYDGKDTLSIYAEMKKARTRQHAVKDKVSHLSATECGQGIAKLQQQDDACASQ